MKLGHFLPLALLACAGLTPAIIPTPKAATANITGDYVEARTAAVFAGACHYNGELVTTGDDAIAAWKFTGGSWKGADLTGLRAMAAIHCDKSLGFENAKRRCEVIVDSSATDAQASAFTDLLKTKSGDVVGPIVSVRRADISFNHDDKGYQVSAKGVAEMNIEPMPDMECCKQPSMVWFNPLFTLDHRMVGYANIASYTEGKIGDQWSRAGENDAFYGAFNF